MEIKFFRMSVDYTVMFTVHKGVGGWGQSGSGQSVSGQKVIIYWWRNIWTAPNKSNKIEWDWEDRFWRGFEVFKWIQINWSNL